MDLVFGWRTAVLTVAMAVLLPLAIALSRSIKNATAARSLAACLIVLIGVLTPWAIGFAGFYDQWRWLSFAPFSDALLFPPLLYLHAYALVHGRWPHHASRMLAPGIAQFTYQSVCFLLPMPIKQRWADMSSAVADTVVAVALAILFLRYGALTIGLLRRYRHLLARERSDDALFAARWVTHSALSLSCIAIVWAGFLLCDAVTPLGYKGLMPLYALIAAYGLYLGISGWAHLAIQFPTMAALSGGSAPIKTRDWASLGASWARRTREERWYRDDALTLARLAVLLGTNTTYLSRALNDGLGLGFSDFINGLRCDDVVDAIAAGSTRPLLELAHDAGFASKASFNRSFRGRYGVSPRAMRSASYVPKDKNLPIFAP